VKAVEEGIRVAVLAAVAVRVKVGARVREAVGEDCRVALAVGEAVAVKNIVANACCVCFRSILLVGVKRLPPVFRMIKSGSTCAIGCVRDINRGTPNARRQVLRITNKTIYFLSFNSVVPFRV
jgi:hypothetical protein